MAVVFSPSNMGTFKTCPLRFAGQSIYKDIKWQASTAKSRGTLVHNVIEKALMRGLDTVSEYPEGTDSVYIKSFVGECRETVANGGEIFVEKEMVITNAMKPTADWWDKNALLRAKADVVVIPKYRKSVLVGDIKTGKRWDSDDFQLRTEALLAHLVFGVSIVEYVYWYVDSGESFGDVIDFSRGLDKVQDVIDVMRDMKLAIRDSNFEAKPNKFCKWCAYYQTPSCKR